MRLPSAEHLQLRLSVMLKCLKKHLQLPSQCGITERKQQFFRQSAEGDADKAGPGTRYHQVTVKGLTGAVTRSG